MSDSPAPEDGPQWGPSRRTVLGASALGGLALTVGLAGDAGLPSGRPDDVLVVVSLRGGFDGLSAVVPAAEPEYWKARPTIGIPASQLQHLDRRFGLHPVMAPLLPFWQSGKLAIVQDVGQSTPTRSHFEAMRELERAAPGSSLRTGWLDRLLGSLPTTTAFEGAQVGTAKPTDAFRGPFPEMALRSIDALSLAETSTRTRKGVQRVYRTLYARQAEVIRNPVFVAMDAVSTAAGWKAVGYQPANGATYPNTDVARALRDVARLIVLGSGLRVACVDVGEWDLHAAMGTVSGGRMRTKLGDLASALAAFATDLGSRMESVTVVTLSEFGRRVAENGSGGTDHGHGNSAFVLGGSVIGGRFYGSWPGLAPSVLVQGDLPGHTDYRQVLAEIAVKRLGAGDHATLFPGLRPSPLGLVRERG
jgi:uncharacterized protein (DUF1501 family)